jgi:hypothetical protein
MARRGVPREVHPPFRCRPWEEIRDWYAALGWPELQPLVDVVDSILAYGGAERLVATTSMHDLWVARMVDGAAASSVDLIKVCAASPLGIDWGVCSGASSAFDGRVQFEHDSCDEFTEDPSGFGVQRG